MIARLAAALFLLPVAAHAEPTACGAPLAFSASRAQLPATQAAIARKSLPILVLGGAAAAGAAARGDAYSYPARLRDRLRAELPGIEVTVTVRAAARRATAEVLGSLETDLRATRPALVIWGPGGSAAARGEDMDAYTATLSEMITRTRDAGADVVMMTLQYAPPVVHLVNLAPYRLATMGIADIAGVPVLDRYEMMRSWNGDGVINLDATESREQVAVARKVFDCVAEALTVGIVHALR